MYIGSQGNNDEGTPTANSWCVGYATSDQLDGPWTSGPGCIIGSGNASGYQAEGFVSFSYNGLCALCIIVTELSASHCNAVRMVSDAICASFSCHLCCHQQVFHHHQPTGHTRLQPR